VISISSRRFRQHYSPTMAARGSPPIPASLACRCSRAALPWRPPRLMVPTSKSE
jgi:hypothetical protein